MQKPATVPAPHQNSADDSALQPSDSTLVRRLLSKKDHLFAALETEDLRELFSLSTIRRFGSDQLIFSRGDPGDGIYVILEGRVGITTMSFEGKEVILNILEEGEVFGEIAVLDGKERTASAVSMEPTDLLFIDRDGFMGFLRQRPTLCLRLLEIVCARLRWTSSIIEDAYFHDVRSKLAKRLLKLAKHYGQVQEHGIVLSIKLSQDEFGRMLGVTRESISKEMGFFQREGILSMKHASMTILDIGKLERLAAAL